VAIGFALEALTDGPVVAVGPGVGYDCRGTQIVNWRRAVVPLPSALQEADLVVSAACGTSFRWREPGRACDDELVLARGHFKDRRAVGLDQSVRHWCRARRFRLTAGVSEQDLKATMVVSTAAGGFADTPYYFATLEYAAAFSATYQLTNETPDGFHLKLSAAAAQWKEAKKKPAARVHWTGVERRPACDFPSVDKEDA
jgi:hypothetical protein